MGWEGAEPLAFPPPGTCTSKLPSFFPPPRKQGKSETTSEGSQAAFLDHPFPSGDRKEIAEKKLSSTLALGGYECLWERETGSFACTLVPSLYSS